MKKIVLLCALISTAYKTATPLTLDFQRRFGPDSALYNEPLYFSKRSVRKNHDHRPRRSYREQIQAKIQREDTQRRR